MTRPHLLVIKIGGSVITDKSQPLTINQPAIDQFAANLYAVLREETGVDVLLGNGAGSFGHHSAHQYDLKNGAKTAEQFYGAAITHNQVRELNLAVTSALTQKNLPAVSVSPGDIFTAKDGVIATDNAAFIELLLANGCVPVVHGDVIFDSARGTCIFSTESSLLWLAERLRESYKKITFATIVNTGGVLDAARTVIHELARTDRVVLLKPSAGHRDVTGGITSKVTHARAAADWADAVYITGNTAEDIRAALHHTTSGTRVF